MESSFAFLFSTLFVKGLFPPKLFMAALGLHCCARAFSGHGKQGVLFIVARGLLSAVASLVAEHGLQVHKLQPAAHRLSRRGTRA